MCRSTLCQDVPETVGSLSMGCTFGRQFVVNELVPGQDTIAVETFEQLDLSNADVNCFWRAFIDMDADDSGSIRADEFFAYFHIENTGLNSKIFMAMDCDNSGYLNFCEFVCAMWNFLGMDPNFLGTLVFYIFDDDKTNSLEYEEIRSLVEVIHHKSGKSASVKKLIDTIMHNHKTVSVEYFTKCCREMSSLCAPLIGMQQSLREKVIGVGYWIDLTAKRGQDPIKSRPDFIQRVAKTIAEKRLQKSIEEVEEKNLKEEQKRADAAAAKSNRNKKSNGRRRRSSYLVQYFVGDGTGGAEKPAQPHLPTKPRARRSSISMLKPSLLKEEFKNKNGKKSNQVQPAFVDIGDHQPTNAEQEGKEGKARLSIDVNEQSTEAKESDLSSEQLQQQQPRPRSLSNQKENGSQTPVEKTKSTKSRLAKGESGGSESSSSKKQSIGSPAARRSDNGSGGSESQKSLKKSREVTATASGSGSSSSSGKVKR